MKFQKLTAAGIVFFISSTAAYAQTAAPTQDEAVAQAEADEIVVTARRRTERLIDVPVAVSSIDASTLERSGVSDVRQLTGVAPSLEVTSTLGDSYGAIIRTRGVGTSGSNPGLESATGFYIDGVFRSRSNLAIGDLPGVERIEVLRGPQGTLFGKNTTAGVVNVTTASPTGERRVSGAIELGGYNLARLDASAEDALTSTLAGRIDVMAMTRKGDQQDRFTDREYGSKDRLQVRGQLLFKPTSDLTVRLIGDYTHRKSNGSNLLIYRTSTPAMLSRLALFGPKPVLQDEPVDREPALSPAVPISEKVEEFGFSGEVNWSTSFGTLTSVTAYRDSRADRSYDPDAAPVDILRDTNDGERYRTFSQELRFQGETGKLNYLFGAFYSNERITSRDSYSFGADYENWVENLIGVNDIFSTLTGLAPGASFPTGAGTNDTFHQTGDSFSIFTHNSVEMLPGLTLAAGARYNWDWKSLDADLYANNPGCAAAITAGGVGLSTIPASLRQLVCVATFDTRRNGHYADSRDESAWTGTASLSYKITSDLNVYGSYSRGYKAGGYQLDRSGLIVPNPDASQLQFQPEKADAFEVGLKMSTLGGGVRANIAAFDTKFKEYQFNYLLTGATGETQRVVINLPELRTRGIELETFFAPLRGLHLSAAATYQDVKFGDSGFPASLSYLEGQQGINAPEWVLAGSANYETRIDEGLKAFFYVDTRYQSETAVSYSAGITDPYRQSGYALVNGRIGIGADDDAWRVELWSRNMFNQAAWASLGSGVFQSGVVQGFAIEPRTIGATIRFKLQ